MTTEFFAWKGQSDQLQRYLVENSPSTAPLLSWFLAIGFYDCEPAEQSVIWSSHGDPFNTLDIVVWIVQTEDRIRVHVSSEAELDQSAVHDGIEKLAHSAAYPQQLPVYFVCSQKQELYERSLQVFKTVLNDFIHSSYNKLPAKQGILYHDVNLLWAPAFHQLFEIEVDAPCFKFVKQASIPLKPVTVPPYLQLDRLYRKDVQLVQSKNKVAYDVAYIEDCIRISSALRTVQTNELAAWGMTHRDLRVGALHVLPDYRRQGLAEILLTDLSKRYIEFFKRTLPNEPLSKLYFGSTVETFNDSSANLFRKTGWTELGLGTTWIYCTIKKQ